ncbi:hypothetical protein BGX34_005689 [Mortierella sp. NVP85]|nr:hypothetical protein BGX34_005689 [Mortierella sp. NVP85]
MSAVDTQNHSLWSSPKDLYSLKRRHTRGKSARSHAFKLSKPSPSSSSVSFSENSLHEPSHAVDPSQDVASPPRAKGRHNGYDTDLNESDRSVRPSGVPSWFGSLRTLTISATSSTKGAFAPLVQSSKSSSRSKGRSSSIFYTGTLEDQDNDSDGNDDHYYDEPLTSRNGLKENRVRGPRMSWNIDPSLGGLLPQSYKTVSGSEPSSPTTMSASPTSLSMQYKVEDLAISHAPSRDDHPGANDADAHPDDAWDALSDDHAAGTSPLSGATTTTTPTSSTFSFIKAYVPSLPSSGGQRNSSGSSTPTGSGFWSIRKLLGSKQYVSLDGPSNQTEDHGVPDDADETEESYMGKKGEKGTMPLTLSDVEPRPARSRSFKKLGRSD